MWYVQGEFKRTSKLEPEDYGRFYQQYYTEMIRRGREGLRNLHTSNPCVNGSSPWQSPSPLPFPFPDAAKDGDLTAHAKVGTQNVSVTAEPEWCKGTTAW
jgi:hypothetical protein